ncbi:heme biosynthesis protein HemY [Chiayiivirga flava]|uniref:HemY protein n=1 Tax=Chiayiivirga flava TaxID=659595 RepID=A0A7W8G1A1_9GAMM|nr:heme biosynthesis HemY N-terminal domain-containing protein [Chiayiivirga flava]MBB5207455.1 HemY protein [Chiayiivirga flava]
MTLFWRLLALLALAILGAWAWQLLAADPGYVLVTLRGYSVETTVVVALAAIALAWLALRIVLWLLRLPFRYWKKRSRRVARERLAGGLVALHEGRWARAEKLLGRAASDPALRLPALLGAARAATARGDAAQADALRQRAADCGDAATVALLDAERLAREGNHAAVAALFDTLPGASLPPRAVELRMRALAATGRASDAVALLPALRQSQLLEGATLHAFEAQISAAALTQAATPELLDERWNALPKSLRNDAAVVGAYAERAAAFGLEESAAGAIEHALKKQWSSSLPGIYSRLPRGRRASPLKNAERWLEQQPNDPALLVALGRLCREEQLWGKAEDTLHRAIAQGAGADAWEELGHTYAAQHDDTRARQAFANALRAARGDAPQSLPGRGLRDLIRDEAVAEERTPMGMPRLPGPE